MKEDGMDFQETFMTPKWETWRGAGVV